MCSESVPKQSAREPILMFSSNVFSFLRGNCNDNNLNCRVLFDFLSLNLVLVFSILLVKPVPSHLDNNSSVTFMLRSKVVQFPSHKHLYPTRYLERRHSPWKLKNNVGVFLALYTNQAQITSYFRLSKLLTYSDGKHHNSEYYH